MFCLVNCIRFPPVSSVLTVIFGGVKIAVGAPILNSWNKNQALIEGTKLWCTISVINYSVHFDWYFSFFKQWRIHPTVGLEIPSRHSINIWQYVYLKFREQIFSLFGCPWSTIKSFDYSTKKFVMMRILGALRQRRHSNAAIDSLV